MFLPPVYSCLATGRAITKVPLLCFPSWLATNPTLRFHSRLLPPVLLIIDSMCSMCSSGHIPVVFDLIYILASDLMAQQLVQDMPTFNLIQQWLANYPDQYGLRYHRYKPTKSIPVSSATNPASPSSIAPASELLKHHPAGQGQDRALRSYFRLWTLQILMLTHTLRSPSPVVWFSAPVGDDIRSEEFEMHRPYANPF